MTDDKYLRRMIAKAPAHLRTQAHRIARDSDGTFAEWAWPGGYPVYHLTKGNDVLCAACANADRNTADLGDAEIVASDINWEDSTLTCDNCSEAIEAAYKDDGE